ncbi:DUF2264 domain-containing protein [Acidobacterium sp. S8]|uniref:DUF2264 domain-containing protein n=1 Tax=Acidobacterium sp. S8 TaxID=1641854 RepID=UPI001C207831|nr:DUF2264 domain-containing protein [Acidobacterium sp. S8]
MQPLRKLQAPPLRALRFGRDDKSKRQYAFVSLMICGLLPLAAYGQTSTGAQDREYSIQVMQKLADPVLTALDQNKLKQTMPVEGSTDRAAYTHLEALGRLLAGMAPWLELGPDQSDEGQLREHYIRMAVTGIAHATDPKSPDFMNFNRGSQPLVDAAFLSLALLRAPKQLWGNLTAEQRTNVAAALKSTRVIHPFESNWLLFSAVIEAALWEFTGECEMQPIETAVNRHMEWYKGDGVYGDGERFHWDYYNSFVIHPLLLEVLRVCAEKQHPLGKLYDGELVRAQRYAAIEERLIAPDGTFPVIGRSSAYRFGAFQVLSEMAWMHRLPSSLDSGAVRAALTAVVRKTMEAPGTFDAHGWLEIGAVGHQPSIGEGYISTGSLYLCSVGLLQLGLPPGDPFWTAPARPWTQKRIWAGEDIPADHAIPN